MLTADSNFTAANALAVKKPVFVMSFADDAGSNQFINTDPAEDPVPDDAPVVDPVSMSHVMVAAGTAGEAQYSTDGVTWHEISASDGSLAFVQASVAGGKLLLGDTGELWASDIGGSYSLSQYWSGEDFRFPAAELDGTVFINNNGENPATAYTWTNTDLDTSWATLDSTNACILLATENRVLRMKYGSYQHSTGGAFANITTMPNVSGQAPLVHAMARCSDTGTLAMIVGTWTGPTRIYTSSDDGLTWTDRAAFAVSGIAYNPNCMAIGNGRLVIAADSGVLYHVTVANLLTGSAPAYAEASPFNQDFFGIAWDGFIDLFIAVGESGRITTSPDGTTWTNRTAAGSYSGDFKAVVAGEFAS